jgi:hypothetical protein
VAGTGALGLGRRLRRVADRHRRSGRRPGWRAGGQVPAGADDDRASVLVGWSAARAEHRGRTWKSARELELDRERWAAPMRCERGYAEQLPDLAVWLTPSTAPAAVIAESGGRREDRQKVILEGWRDAIWSGRYAVVRYDCTSPSVARWITRLAKKAGLTDANFTAAVQTTAAQIAALPPPPPTTTTRRPPPTSPRTQNDRRGRLTRSARPLPRAHGRTKRRQARAPSHPHQTPTRPRPQPSAIDATANSSASMTPSPDADGDADRESCQRLRGIGPADHPGCTSRTTASKRKRAQAFTATRDQDRQLAPALAIDLAALGENHATDSTLGGGRR